MGTTLVAYGLSLSLFQTHEIFRFVAMFSLLDGRGNIHVRVMSDNTSAVSYIITMGGCRSLVCYSLAKEIWDWAIDRNIWLSVAHIPGFSDVDADQLSRNLNLNLE